MITVTARQLETGAADDLLCAAAADNGSIRYWDEAECCWIIRDYWQNDYTEERQEG